MIHAALECQPSQFHRTEHCPGWANLSRDIPRGPSSVPAMEGMIAHELAPMCIEQGISASDYLGWWGYNDGQRSFIFREPREFVGDNHLQIQFNEDFCSAVDVYIGAMLEKRKRSGAISSCEVRLFGGDVIPDMSGTADHLTIQPFGSQDLDDLKFGRGVLVDVGRDVGDNQQLTCYAVLSIADGNPHCVERVVASIIQPRMSHPDGPIRSVEYPIPRLLQWAQDVAIPAIKAAREPDAPVRLGKWCRWCPAGEHRRCPALNAEAGRALEAAFTADLVPAKREPDFTEIPVEDLVRIVNAKERVKNWFEAAEVVLKNKVRMEGPMHDYKCIQGYGHRAFKDEEEAKKVLNNYLIASQMFDLKFKSPAQMEKTLAASGVKPKERKRIMKSIAHKPLGDVKLVPIDDPSPALPPAAEIMFGKPDK